MRYVALARGTVDAAVFGRPPLAGCGAYADLLQDRDWPGLEALNARWLPGTRERFVAQTPTLLADGRHYE